MLFMHTFTYSELFTFAIIKKDRVVKEIFMFSTGVLHLIHEMFWNLPFSEAFTSAKQAEDVRVKFKIPDNVWDAK